MDAATFIQDFPEFSDSTTYPLRLINTWLGVANLRLNPTVWGELLNIGLELFTAHYISIAAKRSREASVGGQPGASNGAVTSKSVDKVSIGYDAALVAYEKGGQWNLTTYGTQFYDLLKVVGAGGIQVGGEGFVIPPGYGFWSPQ